MPDADKIIEAEQSIQNIAAELTRMRDAANLLQGAQVTFDAVIAAAQRVVQTTERFSGECGTIMAKLASTDLIQRLDSLQKLHAEVAETKNDLAEKLRATLDDMRQDLQTASTAIGAAVKATGEQSHSDSEHLAKLLEERAVALNAEVAKVSEQLKNLESEHLKTAKGAKMLSIVIMVFAILGFLAAAGSLAMLLMQ
jgi:DNA repair exonuclease SbcCD ATPase subunit